MARYTCTCIPECRSVRLARLWLPVVARCRQGAVVVRSAGRILERPEGGGVGRRSVCKGKVRTRVLVWLAGWPVSAYGQQ